MLLEIFVGAFAGAIHVARIPFVFRGGNRIDAPVDEDAELRVFVPLRLLVFDQRGPVGTEGPSLAWRVCFGEKAIALRVIFAYRLLPLMIDLGSGLDAKRGRKRIVSCGGSLRENAMATAKKRNTDRARRDFCIRAES